MRGKGDLRRGEGREALSLHIYFRKEMLQLLAILLSIPLNISDRFCFSCLLKVPSRGVMMETPPMKFKV